VADEQVLATGRPMARKGDRTLDWIVLGKD
jgi:hypothetical protein